MDKQNCKKDMDAKHLAELNQKLILREDKENSFVALGAKTKKKVKTPISGLRGHGNERI